MHDFALLKPSLLQLAGRLHRFSALRALAKRIARNWTIQQPFHSGWICLNAVEHSWAWTGKRRLEDFDRFLQDRLLEVSLGRPHLVDIGCNIGVMTLAVLLRNPSAHATAFDPNRQAIALLQRSLECNSLISRAQVLPVAVSAGSRTLSFDSAGSFTGHVAPVGEPCPAVQFSALISEHVRGPSVIKVDIEGFEAELCDEFAGMPHLDDSVLMIELHPRGFNGLGDPARVVEALRRRGDLRLHLLDGEIESLDCTQFRHLEATFAP